MSDLAAADFDCIRLYRSPQVGPVAYAQLIARFGGAAAALAAIPDMAQRGGARSIRLADERDIAAEARRTIDLGGRYLIAHHADYPALLAEVDGAPPVLIVRGDTGLATKPSVAMVGARNASAAACRMARDLAAGLGQAGHVVVSGLARGVDTAAHLGSIDTGTIGVIASGIDIAFPRENAELQERIAQEGLLITEQPPGVEPLARHFPARNRIIAWMSVGTVVVEAAPRSGSLLTARLAGEAGREVMAVPGFPADPRAQGCNALIRDGATLVQNAGDIAEQIAPLDHRALRSPKGEYRAPPPPVDVASGDRARVTGLLGHAPVMIDELCRQSGCPAGIVQTVLLELELAGRLARHAGGRVSLV